MRRWILGAALAAASVQTHASVFIAAHPDDIELFMSVNASADVKNGARTVFILTTAGDNGYKTSVGDNDSGIPYYRARLIAHEKAIRFWRSLSGKKGTPTQYQTMVVAGHTIERADIDDVTIVNMNLPDGVATDGTTLTGLLYGQVATLTTIDGSNTYTLPDLKETIRQIIAQTQHGVSDIWVNFQNEDTSVNVNDHADHNATARIVAAALAESTPFACTHKARYLDYVVGTLPVNETDDQRDVHYATWGALNSGLFDNGNRTTYEPTHNVWLGRQYVTLTPGPGNCML
jgi:LmbE family N-acetylglucosaminyl deacetylase